MDHRPVVVPILAAALALMAAAPAARAQTVGTFRWQLQPYCNVVTVTVTQVGGVYTLSGTDDQCGAATLAAAAGTAFPNPNGTIGFGFSLVATPGGSPLHVDAALALSTLGGTWRDSAGRSGAFVFTPGAGTGGAPLPPQAAGDITAVTAGSGLVGGGTAGSVDLSVDTAVIQRRVTGACQAGQVMSGVNQNGTVTCVATSGAGGDITGVTAGLGLTGGGLSGDVTLNVAFGGSGTLPAAARMDHTHGRGGGTTAVGDFAVPPLSTGSLNTAVGYTSLESVTSGGSNTGVGASTLLRVSTGNGNTAVGRAALTSAQFGSYNTGIAEYALTTLDSGDRNTAVGYGSLYVVSQGDSNTALGNIALSSLGTGGYNTAIGDSAGINLTAGSRNLYVGNEGITTENSTIRVGSGLWHTRLFLGASRGITTGLNNAIPLVIDSNGQVGTLSSSRRTKQDIEDLGVGQIVQQLRPVQFRYIQPFADGSRPIQYGLVAEEVEAVLPALVAYGADGAPESVKYHVLPTLLLAEVQRLERERAATAARLDAAVRELEAVRELVSSLKARLKPPAAGRRLP